MRRKQVVQEPLKKKSLEFKISDIIELLNLKVQNYEMEKQMVNRAKDRDCEESHYPEIAILKYREQDLRANEN